ncbi:hypothetical protein NVP1243O_14 [Vibrio phage 1.243.O._10N.261.54.B5]|nr:hypothetical protein NVP1243O_14 [Vibrio phage 1.243.O._10N.261.54.B5]
MITCKEDLMNTYIENDFGDLRKTYIGKAIELGYNHQGNRERGLDWYDLPYIAINDSWDDAYVGQTADVTRGIRFSESKILTLSDLKPTPTKFVKVEESILDLKGEFERGELYSSDCEGHYTQLKCEKKLYLAAHLDSVYRQVEIDWRDEVVKSLPAGYGVESFGGKDIRVNGMFDKEQALILANAIIASLTEKPEGV